MSTGGGGVFNTVGYSNNKRFMISTVDGYSVLWGYHDAHGGYHECHGGVQYRGVLK